MDLLERGFTPPIRLFGIPFRVHFTVPIGLAIMSRFTFAPGFWLGFLLVILVHELGHAVLVRSRGLRVVGIDLTGFGGVCKHTAGTERDTIVIAWGGVLGQLVLGLLAFGLRSVLFARLGDFGLELYLALTEYSAVLAAINLMPLPGLDGGYAWRIVKDWKRSPSAKPTISAAAKRRADERGVVVRLDQYKAKVKAEDESEPEVNPSVQAEMERILREATKKRKDERDKRDLN